MKHKHAELMLQYAQDAMETDKPWERWQILCGDDWTILSSNPMWDRNTKYRRKPRTIRIGDYDVPEPMRKAPEEYADFFVSTMTTSEPYKFQWYNKYPYTLWLSMGICHATKEAAELHRKALLSFTAKGGEA